VPPAALRCGSVPVLEPAAAAEAPASWESGVPGVALARGVTLSVAPGRMPALLLLTARSVSPVRTPDPTDVPPVPVAVPAEFDVSPASLDPLVPALLLLLLPPLTVPPYPPPVMPPPLPAELFEPVDDDEEDEPPLPLAEPPLDPPPPAACANARDENPITATPMASAAADSIIRCLFMVEPPQQNVNAAAELEQRAFRTQRESE
jgi:hypothetical protein